MTEPNSYNLASQVRADVPASSCVVYPMPQPDIIDKLDVFVVGVAIGIASMAVAVMLAEKLKGG